MTLRERIIWPQFLNNSTDKLTIRNVLAKFQESNQIIKLSTN